MSAKESQELATTPALILCGGLGTRFRPVRDDIPKALAPLGAQPFLTHLIEQLSAQGIKQFIFATGHLHQHIADYCRDYFATEKGKQLSHSISWEEKPLGTAGAIRNALPQIHSDRFFVLNGDSSVALSLEDQLALHLKQKAAITLLLSSATQGEDYGNVTVEDSGLVTGFEEKPSSEDKATVLINAGVYCVSRTAVKDIPEQQNISLEKDLIPKLILEKQVAGLVINSPVRDIGTPERYETINKIYEEGKGL